jgi:hypothetical protein
MAMTESRKCQIGLILLLQKWYKEGVTVGQPLNRVIGNVVKETGISKEELVEFTDFAINHIRERTLHEGGSYNPQG